MHTCTLASEMVIIILCSRKCICDQWVPSVLT